MKEVYKLLANLEMYRARLDSDITRERLPPGFWSHAAALTITNGLDQAIDVLLAALEMAKPMNDAADERNTQEDALR